jgi:protein-disulfide isomerase
MNVTKSGLRSIFDVATAIVMLIAAGTLIYKNVFQAAPTARTELAVPTEPLSIEGDQIRGSADARAVMVVYSDFQCPFCRRFAREVLPEIDRRYVATGKLALAFRHLPLPMHQHATRAAVMAECAGQQDRFWEMHDALFAQEALDEQTLMAIPKLVGLNSRIFEECLVDKLVTGKVQASAEGARALNVRSTPSFFLARLDKGRATVLRAISGARPIEDVAEQLDGVLVRASASSPWWAALLGID